MKYVVLLCDGMADLPNKDLNGKTPMEASKTPFMDKLSKKGEMGLVKTVADDLKPGSDVANLSVLGYDPHLYYSGRSPLEAGSIGIDMKASDVSFRCNLVTVTEEENYADKTIVDYCAGDIHTAEAKILIDYLKEHFDNEEFQLFSGVSYRHCLIWDKGTTEVGTLTPPHDITGKAVKDYLPNHENAKKLYAMMVKSYELLKNHPINIERVKKGERPANSAWFWGEGVRKDLPSFKEKYGLNGAMISAVDLLKGIGKFTGMDVIEVEGATGYIDTNFEGKANAAVETLKNGNDFVYIHVEAPDECGHRNEVENKVLSLEYIDERVLKIVLEGLEEMGDYRILIVPDHATPLELKTHTNDPVPYLIYDSRIDSKKGELFSEKTAENTGVLVSEGYKLMEKFLEK